MPFTGNENHDIELNRAVLLTKEYRDSNGPDTIRAIYFSKSAIIKVLDQTDCVGIRIYNAIKDGKHTFAIVGVKANQEDLEDGYILENGFPCPPICGISGQL